MSAKILIFIVSSLLMSCASTPLFDDSQVSLSLTPQMVIAEPDNNRGKNVLWGGTILEITNLKNSTQIEVLAYSLRSSYRPKIKGKPLGRFIVLQQGYLEPTEYAQGKLLTVLGGVSDIQAGNVGESTYLFPVINAQQLKLWTVKNEKYRSSFHIGLGVRL